MSTLPKKLNFTIAICPFVVAILIFSGLCCKKKFTDETVTILPPVINGPFNVEGLVMDENGMPMYNASVKAGNKSTQTDRFGIFRIEGAVFNSGETFATVTKQDYFKGSRTFAALKESNNFIKVRLLPKDNSARVPSTSGGKVNIVGNGGTIGFEPNSFSTLSGSPYVGEVTVASYYLNPEIPAVHDQMPGDLMGTDLAGTLVGLNSFGMVAIELLGEAGQQLQIKNGYKATLTLTIPSSKVAAAPPTIPLWYFNDSTGLWKEEGLATKVGNAYRGDVTHFSFWNLDSPTDFVFLEAKIVNTAGQPVAGIAVRVSDFYSVHYDYSDNNGIVKGWVPKNQQLNFKVLNLCNQAIFDSTIGPFLSFADLGSIRINENVYVIHGTVSNCSGASVTDGFAQLIFPNGTMEYTSVVNGVFSFRYFNCMGNTTAQLMVTDNSLLQQSSPALVSLTGPLINVGPVTVCASPLQNFYFLNIGNSSFNANSAEYIYEGGRYEKEWIAGQPDSLFLYTSEAFSPDFRKYVFVDFYFPKDYLFNTPVSIRPTVWQIRYKWINGTSDTLVNRLVPLNPAQIHYFTEYGPVGQFISGNLSGTFARWKTVTSTITTKDTVTATINFRVKHVATPTSF